MKKIVQLIFSALLSVQGFSQEKNTDSLYPIIPKPQKIVAKGGVFNLNSKTKIVLVNESPDLKRAANFFIELLAPSTGFTVSVDNKVSSNAIVISLDAAYPTAEGYQLKIDKGRINIKTKTAAGAFMALQTIRQLLPAEVEKKELAAVTTWSIPCAEIEDTPRFEYRGMHLDVGRHTFPPSFIKRYIDLLALFKFNTFHWHLTEDQGWRIEIKKYPKLTAVGGWRKETAVGQTTSDTPILQRKFDCTPYQGFYTQDEIHDIVKYAQDRFITIVPEIEMPGHSLAALTAYPELGCTDGPYEVASYWGVFRDVFCTKDATFKFLEDVLTEVAELFPSKYIHIGGDECPKERWKTCAHCQNFMKENGIKNEHELQSYFIQRIEKFINSKGRQIIGWDEILEGGLAPNATVMSWRGTEGGITAAKQKHDVIMTPGTHCYFDHYQSKNKNEPLAIGGFTNVEKVYSYEPVPSELSVTESKFIKGAQANVWTEYIATPEHVEYMVFPRALAMAEVLWTQKSNSNYNQFLLRLKKQAARLDALKVNYAKHVFEK
jgi:hexosaminidase